MRVELSDHEMILLGTTDAIDTCFAKLNKLRGVLGWYSMKLEIDSAGKVTANYGYDPKATEDPSFFDD
jgi:hypothetical protein